VFPILLNVRARRAVVIGGGAVAERKVRGLLDAGAAVTVISPTLTPKLKEQAAAAALTWHERRYAPSDLNAAFLVFSATNDDAVNAAVTREAHERGLLVNDAGDAERGDFTTPATHRAGPLTVTVDSSGLSPSFTKRIRDELALQFDARYGRAAATLGSLREHVAAVVPLARRAAVMRKLAERDIDDLAAMPRGDIEHEVERTVTELDAADTAVPATLICASRASALAMTQTRLMMAKLGAGGIASTVLNITTKGDAVQDRSLTAIGTDSLFVKELENALRDRRADYAVHSCKDLPSTLPEDMQIAAITKREDPRDAFCSEKYANLAALPKGARVGTSSPRRRAQLHALRPDLVYDDIRGNVDTRLRKLRDGQYDAIVLAAAGMNRLGLRATHTVPFDPTELLPAVGQGALALETCLGNAIAPTIDRLVGDRDATLAVSAERAYLRTLRGGCQAPVGAYGVIADGRLFLRGAIAALDGSTVIRGERSAAVDTIADAEAVGEALAHELLERGGDAILAALTDAIPQLPVGPLSGRLFVLPRTQDRPSRISPALRDQGAEVVEASDSATLSALLGERIPDVILFPSSGSVIAITEYLTGLRENVSRPVVAAMGPASSEAALACGFPPDVIAPSAEIGSFVQTVTRFVLEKHS